MTTKAKYTLTDEHRAQLPAWRDKWIANAMSTKAMDETEREIMRRAVRGLYGAAGLTPPPDHRIVFVPSPMVLRLAGGFAASIWYDRKKATYAATDAATFDATRAATDMASWVNIRVSVIVNVAANILGARAEFGLRCSYQAYSMWQGGNQWSAWDSFLSFFRHVAKLPIDYSKYEHWETAAIHGGPRIMHPDFCMISDRPDVLLVDGQGRPHCTTGPFCRWRDGFALYSVHGVRVPWDIIENNATITVARIEAEENAEVRRVMIDLYKSGRENGGGAGAYLTDSGAKIVHEDLDLLGATRRLLRKEVPDDEPILMIDVRNSTPEPDGSWKQYQLRVDPNAYGGRASRECQAAIASTWRDVDGSMLFPRPEDYRPAVET